MKKKSEFPVSVKRGNVELLIYPSEKTKTLTNGQKKSYTEYRFHYYEAGQRKMKASSDLPRIKREAEFIANKLSAGEADVLTLSSEDRVVYLKLKEIESRMGVPLLVAATEYEAARKIVPPSTPLTDVAKFYDKRNPSKMPRRTVTEVYQEFVASKRRDGLSDAYVSDLDSRCGGFAGAFQCQIADVTATDIKKFLVDLNVTGRTQNNYCRVVNTLFEFAKAQGYLAKDHDVMEHVAKLGMAKNEVTDIDETSIFTPVELSRLLAKATDDILPAYVIGAFTGMRHSEVMRLTWDDVKFERKFITVWGTVARKKKETRRPPMLPNLAKWLTPYKGRTGNVWPHSTPYYYELTEDLCKAAKIEWRKNVLRHSFISYRVAQIRNRYQTAEEAGTSPAKIRSNYLELVTFEDAEKWFSIAPGALVKDEEAEAQSHIVGMEQAA